MRRMQAAMRMMQTILELARVSNLPTSWTNVIAAWLLAGGDWTVDLLWMLAGASFLYSAGMMLNDAADAKWDATHKADRAIPSGRISARSVWLMGFGGMAFGAVLCILAGAQWWWVLALVLAILFYDLFHKPWAGSVLIMGACRMLLYVVAASANSLTADVWLWGVLLGVYIVALSLVAREEGRGTITDPRRWLYLLLLLLPSLAVMKPDVSLVQIALFFSSAALILFCLRQMKCGRSRIGDAVGWLLAGIPLVDALALSDVQPQAALAMLLLPPLLKVWQRWVAAT